MAITAITITGKDTRLRELCAKRTRRTHNTKYNIGSGIKSDIFLKATRRKNQLMA